MCPPGYYQSTNGPLVTDAFDTFITNAWFLILQCKFADQKSKNSNNEKNVANSNIRISKQKKTQNDFFNLR